MLQHFPTWLIFSNRIVMWMYLMQKLTHVLLQVRHVDVYSLTLYIFLRSHGDTVLKQTLFLDRPIFDVSGWCYRLLLSFTHQKDEADLYSWTCYSFCTPTQTCSECSKYLAALREMVRCIFLLFTCYGLISSLYCSPSFQTILQCICCPSPASNKFSGS